MTHVKKVNKHAVVFATQLRSVREDMEYERREQSKMYDLCIGEMVCPNCGEDLFLVDRVIRRWGFRKIREKYYRCRCCIFRADWCWVKKKVTFQGGPIRVTKKLVEPHYPDGFL